MFLVCFDYRLLLVKGAHPMESSPRLFLGMHLSRILDHQLLDSGGHDFFYNFLRCTLYMLHVLDFTVGGNHFEPVGFRA